MGTRRPAKLAIGKKERQVKLCPITGKEMTAVKVIRRRGASGMHWVVLDEFDGGDKSIDRMIRVR